MKRFVFVGIFSLLAVVIYAQSWTIDGSIELDFYKWDNSVTSEDTTYFSLSLKVGRYVTDKLNIGLSADFGRGTTGINYTVGPFFKFDFYKFEKVYFDITGGVYYTKYNGSYSWNDDYSKNDANRIVVRLAPSVTYMVNENVEVYWQFATLSYRYDWLTLKNTTTECKVDEFRIAGPFRDPTFGIRFRF
jgi:hypothetical protein